MESSVLFKSPDNAAIVIDIPRSLEEAQALPGQPIKRRIVSTQSMETPWQVPEPKQDGSAAKQHVLPSAAGIAELMTLETVKAAIETVRVAHQGPWCLPRVIRERTKKSEPEQDGEGEGKVGANRNEHTIDSNKRKYKPSSPTSEERENTEPAGTISAPEKSCYLLGTIESQREVFLEKAPEFDLIILDPPWPSRSVKRKSHSYGTVQNIEEAGDLLSQIPVRSHLKRDGLVAIWITNKAAITDLLLASTGTLAQWGLEPIGEWVWLKVTSTGEPILDIESAWRKPWERLLIARHKGNSAVQPIQTKVLLGVPDTHSRKPNLRGLFEEVLPQGYLGLEIFARNLTAGWWSWGDEVLSFQKKRHWVAIEDKKAGQL